MQMHLSTTCKGGMDMAGEVLSMEQDRRTELEDRYLLFYIEQMLHSVELQYVIEIITVQRVTHLPNLPEYVKGIINLRGKVIPVIDIRLNNRCNHGQLSTFLRRRPFRDRPKALQVQGLLHILCTAL